MSRPSTQDLVEKWFQLWESGQFLDLPLTDTFTHTSPYGTIKGKSAYLELAGANEDMFLGNTFEFHDRIYGDNKACVRYTMRSRTGSLEVTEWFYFSEGAIDRIVSYYNLEEEKKAGRGIKILD